MFPTIIGTVVIAGIVGYLAEKSGFTRKETPAFSPSNTKYFCSSIIKHLHENISLP